MAANIPTISERFINLENALVDDPSRCSVELKEIEKLAGKAECLAQIFEEFALRQWDIKAKALAKSLNQIEMYQKVQYTFEQYKNYIHRLTEKLAKIDPGDPRSHRLELLLNLPFGDKADNEAKTICDQLKTFPSKRNVVKLCEQAESENEKGNLKLIQISEWAFTYNDWELRNFIVDQYLMRGWIKEAKLLAYDWEISLRLSIGKFKKRNYDS